MGDLPEPSLAFIAILTGWFTAEVGRQPWTVYGLLRTAHSRHPALIVPETVASLAMFVCIHTLIFGFGIDLTSTACCRRALRDPRLALRSLQPTARPDHRGGQTPSPEGAP